MWERHEHTAIISIFKWSRIIKGMDAWSLKNNVENFSKHLPRLLLSWERQGKRFWNQREAGVQWLLMLELVKNIEPSQHVGRAEAHIRVFFVQLQHHIFHWGFKAESSRIVPSWWDNWSHSLFLLEVSGCRLYGLGAHQRAASRQPESQCGTHLNSLADQNNSICKIEYTAEFTA